MSIGVKIIEESANFLGFGEKAVYLYDHDGDAQAFPLVLQLAVRVMRDMNGDRPYMIGALCRTIIGSPRRPRREGRRTTGNGAPGQGGGFGVSSTGEWRGDLNVVIDLPRQMLGELRYQNDEEARGPWWTFDQFLASRNPESMLWP